MFALQAFFSFPSILDYVVSGQIDQCISICQVLPALMTLVEVGRSYRFMIQFCKESPQVRMFRTRGISWTCNSFFIPANPGVVPCESLAHSQERVWHSMQVHLL